MHGGNGEDKRHLSKQYTLVLDDWQHPSPPHHHHLQLFRAAYAPAVITAVILTAPTTSISADVATVTAAALLLQLLQLLQQLLHLPMLCC